MPPASKVDTLEIGITCNIMDVRHKYHYEK